MILANSTIPELPWQVVLGVAVFTTALIMWTRRRIARQPLNPRAAARNRAADARGGRESQAELRELLLELERAAREITAQIDTRFRKLETIVRDADKRIAELRSLSSSDGQAQDIGSDAPLDVLVGDDGPVAASAANSSSTGVRPADIERVYALADRKVSPRDIATRVHRSVSEVELMLAMRARRASGAGTATPS